MTTEEREAMEARLNAIAMRYCRTEIEFGTEPLRRAAEEFDNCGETDRAQAVRRALAELDEAKAGL